ncbi:sensor histidine kinase KdpD [Pseudogulbenkiania sp. MAI-1]|uniref:sensor histidine kinase n=1 Tax=Pseudogulbenkiania sp. MAI-1 TaxID=990370 RepID=UPI00045E8E20|nr:HAMP domain-containing sensor histidine kinase [Pseudogulbenkiania sp. MAI-1]
MLESDNSPLDISTFLVASIHDMKNSLCVINAMLEDVIDQTSDHCCPAHESVGQVLYESQRVAANLLQLLVIYKLGKGLYPFDPQEHDLTDFTLEAISRVTHLAQCRAVNIHVECAPDLYWYFDRELVLGAIVQALNNGVRYTSSKVCLQIGIKDGMLEFRVEDNGPGYPASMLEEQLPATRGISFTTGNTGLGLYFSSIVAEQHQHRGRHGTTRLENGGTLGGGAFVMTLP